MSQAALLLAVRDRLRQPVADGGLGYTASQCDIEEDGRPDPVAGEFYVAIQPGEWQAQDSDAALDETYGVEITVTLRSARAPFDRFINSIFLKPQNGLQARCEEIRAKLHLDPGPRSATDASHYPVLALANTTIGAGENGFIEPLRFRSAGPVELKYSDWFLADPLPGNPPVGMARTLSFGGARRVQLVGEQS